MRVKTRGQFPTPLRSRSRSLAMSNIMCCLSKAKLRSERKLDFRSSYKTGAMKLCDSLKSSKESANKKTSELSPRECKIIALIEYKAQIYRVQTRLDSLKTGLTRGNVTGGVIVQLRSLCET